ncbi:specifically androgen-regulated gene protein isoform X2 [Xiphophorus couchianus]|uniref:specifically androgen-regulated gene protein isoform X2 n=1 Tax=Xiphophorus couchianus TaxID=32473 RepID=UPI001016B3FE|nr:specifically androgen-regulated gene protein-like isoform X2 [Xiphophorus couchianus]
MSKSGTWPGNVAMESLSNMDSAGSYDSVISTNSAWSEDSMEYLSAEEKACLMFLEETIEALEVQEDSGLSNDEPDMWSKTEPQDQIRSNDVPTEMLKSGSLRISTLSPHTTAVSPSAGLTTEYGTEHHAANQNSNPQSASTSAVSMKDVKTEDLGVETDPLVSNSGYTTSSSDKTVDVSKLDGDLVLENVTNSGDASENDLDIIPPPTDFRDEPEPDLLPEAMTVVPPPAAMTVEAMTMVPPPETMTVVPPPETMTVVPPPETMTVVPPPEAMTVVPPPEAITVESMTVVPPPEAMTVVLPPETITVEAMTVVPPPETMTVVPPPAAMTVEATSVVLPPEATASPPPSNGFTKQKQTVDVEQMRMRASVKRSVVDSSAAEDSSSKASEVASLLPQMNPPTEPLEPRNPPAVAPKPKKLPSSIILKSPKTPTLVSHGNPGHSVPSHSDRMLLDPQKVHMEALKKLGLLKENKEEASRAVSPKISLKSASYKWSPASPSPPVSPAALLTPPVTPSLTPVISPLQAIVPQQSVQAPIVPPSASSASPPIEDADILPAPAAFSDGFGPSGDELPAVTEAPFSTLPNTSPPKGISMKSATLERSGLGLSSQMFNRSLLEITDDEQDPKHLRNTRPRPASLGTRKDFSHTKGEGLVASGTSESQKSQPTQAFHRRESSKLPRSQGISVMICPRAENEEDRRQALKKLGLLRD